MLIELPDSLARELVAAGVGRIPCDPMDDVAGERPTEMSEAELARHLDRDPELLRSYRRNHGIPPTYYRKVGRSVVYDVASMEYWAAKKLGR